MPVCSSLQQWMMGGGGWEGRGLYLEMEDWQECGGETEAEGVCVCERERDPCNQN